MWKKSDIPESAEKLKAEGYSELASLVMAKAGIGSKEQAEEFLHSETVHDPAKISKRFPKSFGITYTGMKRSVSSGIMTPMALPELPFCI